MTEIYTGDIAPPLEGGLLHHLVSPSPEAEASTPEPEPEAEL